MSLLKEIRKGRSRLCHTTTVVTTAEGKVFEEESFAEGFCVSKPFKHESSLRLGFIIDLKPDLEVAEVLPRLYLGSQDVTQELCLLQKHNITDIISLGIKIAFVDSMTIEYHCFNILDLPETEIINVLNNVLPLVHKLLEQGRVVFVHCNAGVSRSPSIVIAYLMRYKGMSFWDAYELVRSKRPSIKPNPGFIEQLKKFEALCNS